MTAAEIVAVRLEVERALRGREDVLALLLLRKADADRRDHERKIEVAREFRLAQRRRVA